MKSFLILLGIIAGISPIILVGHTFYSHKNKVSNNTVFETNFGNFLAYQHAIYINDFDTAANLVMKMDDKNSFVSDSKKLTMFLNGQMPDDVKSMKDSKNLSYRLIYDSSLLKQDKWKEFYNRHKKEESNLMTPLRIFSSVKQGNIKEAEKIIDSLKTNSSWKAFVRGQIAVLNNDIEKAAKEFADVHPDFMNINDYLYLMSFYKEHNMMEDVEILKNDFIAKPGSLYMLDYEEIPDWSIFSGYKNNIAFSIIQNVSHSQIMLYSDISLLMLRFAEAISDNKNTNAINYYLGQYYLFNSGDYKTSFNSIDKNHPLYLFGQTNMANKEKNFKRIEKIANTNPLFINAVQSVISKNIKEGKKKNALKIVNNALNQENLNDAGKYFFLKHRANIYLMFNDVKKAQKDIDSMKIINDNLTYDMLLLQARSWNKQKKNLDDAYDYAMALVKTNTSDVTAWNILGAIVASKEGTDNALEVLERVGALSVKNSSLYEHLGDLYLAKGDKEKAKQSYLQAINLSDDGLTVVPFVQKKLRKIK